MKRAIRLKIFILDTNPMKDIEKPTVAPYIAGYYSAKELNTIFNIFKGDKIEMPVILASHYGLRRSEVLGIRWSAIDFENKCIHINRSVIKVIGKGENQVIIYKDFTKNNDIRTLPLIPTVEKKLLKHKKWIEENKMFYGSAYIRKAEEYVCIAEDGTLIPLDYITHHFKEVLDNNSDKIQQKKFHSLRHSVGTLLSQRNVNQKSIQTYLGHKNIRSSEIYQHANYDNQVFSASVIAEQLQKAAGQ